MKNDVMRTVQLIAGTATGTGGNFVNPVGMDRQKTGEFVMANSTEGGGSGGNIIHSGGDGGGPRSAVVAGGNI